MVVVIQKVLSHKLPSKSRAKSREEKRRSCVDRRVQAQKRPRVIIPSRKSNQVPPAMQQVWTSARTVSQALLFKDRSLSVDDVEVDSERSDDDALVDELSMDQLPTAALRPTLHETVLESHGLQHIDWVFWISQPDKGYWKPLSEFPRTTRTRFVDKFNTDYLAKPTHITLYARMLRLQHRRLHSDQCVGNVTHASRNMPSTWNKTGPGKEITCDTCFGRRRFCARLVSTRLGIQLGFYPLPLLARKGVMWSELRYWVRDG
jgi:hypothetical protein